MTQMSYTAKTKGQAYTMTVEAVTTPNGKAGVKLTCTCPVHAAAAQSVIMTWPKTVEEFPRNLIHGHVAKMADPIAVVGLAKMGKAWKA